MILHPCPASPPTCGSQIEFLEAQTQAQAHKYLPDMAEPTFMKGAGAHRLSRSASEASVLACAWSSCTS